MPSTWNQRLCDISPGAKGTAGNVNTAGATSAAALLATNPRFLQLRRATGSDEFAPPPRPAGRVLACARHMGQLWVSGPRLWAGAWATLMGFAGGCPLVPRGHTTASQTPCGSLGSLPAPRLLAQLVYGAKAETRWTDACLVGSPGPAVRATPCGEGRWLTFSLNSSKPLGRTVMSFLLQRDLRAPPHGFSLWHIARRGWHRCPARGLALDRQHPGSLENRHRAYMRRVPHQPTVGPHSSPLLHQGQAHRDVARGDRGHPVDSAGP